MIAAAAHPGYAATNLQAVGPRMDGSAFMEMMMTQIGNRYFSQSAEMGALPTNYAAAAKGVVGGDYIGPDGFGEMRGYPTKVGMSGAAKDPTSAARLWDVSENLTGVKFAALD